jgi:hypothetical protein
MIIFWILPRAVNSGPHIFCVIFSSGIEEANIQPWGLHVYIEYNMIEELRLYTVQHVLVVNLGQSFFFFFQCILGHFFR